MAGFCSSEFPVIAELVAGFAIRTTGADAVVLSETIVCTEAASSGLTGDFS